MKLQLELTSNTTNDHRLKRHQIDAMPKTCNMYMGKMQKQGHAIFKGEPNNNFNNQIIDKTFLFKYIFNFINQSE